MCTCPGTKIVYYNMHYNISIIFRYGFKTQKLLMLLKQYYNQCIRYTIWCMLKIICYDSYQKQET